MRIKTRTRWNDSAALSARAQCRSHAEDLFVRVCLRHAQDARSRMPVMRRFQRHLTIHSSRCRRPVQQHSNNVYVPSVSFPSPSLVGRAVFRRDYIVDRVRSETAHVVVRGPVVLTSQM